MTNGLIGAWGPIVTPFLLHRGLSPRFAVGWVKMAEVAVAAVAAGSILASAGKTGLELQVVAAMLTGGVIAAPVAAWSVRRLPARPMGLAVAALLLLTSHGSSAGGPNWVGRPVRRRRHRRPGGPCRPLAPARHGGHRARSRPGWIIPGARVAVSAIRR